MARLIGPDEAVRVVYLTSGTNKGKALAQGMSAPIYLDQALTTLADFIHERGSLRIDQVEQLASFLGYSARLERRAPRA